MKQRTGRNKEKDVRKGRIRRKEYEKPGENNREQKEIVDHSSRLRYRLFIVMRVGACRSECVLSSTGHGLRYVPHRPHIRADVGSAERT
jgi:hypothetical protein